MKHQPLWTAAPVWATALAVATLAFASCNDRDDYPTTTTTKTGQVTVKEYAYAQREDFRRDMETSLQKLDARIAELRAKAASASADAKVKMEEAADKLDAELDELRADLSDVGSSTAATWVEFKTNFKNTMNDLERRLEDAFD